tara:strand:- start:117 stop:218 length:102 start_codon:yes stop_codon:yes gene_type:complete
MPPSPRSLEIVGLVLSGTSLGPLGSSSGIAAAT